MKPWNPMTKPLDLKHLGKLGEELGEASAAVSRCLIQGMHGAEPISGKINRKWLEEEIADVLANCGLVIGHFDLDIEAIAARADDKAAQLHIWHAMPEDGE